MRRAVLTLALFAVLDFAAVSAQWPIVRSLRVPRTADGRPDLRAPTPRAPDGKPDLTGVWENPGWRELGQQSGDVSGTGGSPGSGRALSRVPGPGLFFDIGSGVEGGLPFTPLGAELRRKRMADNSKDNPDAHCLPLGNLQLHTHPQPRKFVQTPDLLLVLYEGNAGVRQIFLDGRRLPDNDPQPWWFGYSAGRWAGDTLVVETSGFRDGGWLDVNGSPLTDAAHVTERFTRVNYGTMTIDVSVTDPRVYTRPWTVSLSHRLMPDDELLEFICLENEKSTPHFR